MRKDFTGHEPRLLDMGRMRSKGSIYSGGTVSAIADRARRRRILAGYPLAPFNMSDKQITEYFSGETIVCLLCGKHYRALNEPHLMRVHEVTIDDYKNMFGLPFKKGLLCSGLYKIRAEQGKDKTKYLINTSGMKRKKARLNAYAIEKRRKNIKVASDSVPRKITENDMIKIRKIYKKGKYTQREIGDKFGVSQSMIWSVVNEKH